MQHLDFILWMILFPISVSIGEYISAKKRQITKEPEIKFSEKTERFAGFIVIVIWLFIGYKLF